MSPAPPESCWLMKAEPDSRVVKGQDVKVGGTAQEIWLSALLAPQFSVDDFERVGTTPWEGVRNHEAKNLMMQMRIGDQVCPVVLVANGRRFIRVLIRFCSTIRTARTLGLQLLGRWVQNQ